MGGIGDPGTSRQSTTELYDGTSWTTTASMSTARGIGAGAGTQTAALVFGGPPGPQQATEEFISGARTVTISGS